MFRKNVAGQFIHVQGVDATTGGIKSGVTWTVRRCIDGTFAAATGTATEDGTTGWYKFALSQADTNGNNIGFGFTGTGAIPQTINIVTTAADPTDGVRLGLTALPNAAADAAGGLPISDAGGLDLDAQIGTKINDILTDTGTTLQGELDGIQADTEDIQTKIGAPAGASVSADIAAVKVDTAAILVDTGTTLDGKIDSILDDTGTSGVVVAAGSKTGYSIASGGIGSGAHAAAELNAIADAHLDRNMATGVDSGADNTTTRTVRQALRILRNKRSVAAGTLTVTKENDTTASWTAAVGTAAGDPTTSVDPT